MMDKLRPTVKRNLSLFSIEGWWLGYSKYFQEIFGQEYPIFFHFDGHKVNFYHRLSDFEKFKKVYTRRLIDEDDLFETCNRDFQQHVKHLRALLASLSLDTLQDVQETVGRIMSFYIFIVGDNFVAARPAAWESRHLSEGILYEVDEAVERLISQTLTARKIAPTLAHVMTRQDVEASTAGRTDVKELTLRSAGYIFHTGQVIVGQTFSDFCRAQGLELPIEEKGPSAAQAIQGATAYQGEAEGRVCIVSSRQDLEKVEPGDVLVSIMTNATYAPVFPKVVAIVTDEGGITCHAAIVARELKKPCVVGTKNATHTLRDGQRVMVDASKGIVTIIS